MNKIYQIPKRMLSVSHRNWNICGPTPDYGPVEVQRSCLLNGIVVGGAKPLGGLISACTIMYQAGSQYEVDNSLGATHFLRAASSASSCAFSGFTKMRYMGQKGVSLTCTSDRQSIAYTLRCPVTAFAEMKCFLLDTVLRCCFRQWEIDDLKPLIKDDLHRIDPLQRVIDLAQKACWAGPLSNSMFCVPSRIQGMTGEDLNNYANHNFKTDHCTVASIGVPYEETLKLAEAIEPRRMKPEPRTVVCSRPRAGFEYYDLGRDSDTWICVVVPGCGTMDISELIRHSIVAHACGTSNMHEGSHSMDRMQELPLGLTSGEDLFTTYRAFNISYYDTGVFGIVAKTRACSAWDVAKAAAQFLAKVGDLNDNQIDIGKKRLSGPIVIKSGLNDGILEKSRELLKYYRRTYSDLEVSLALHDDDYVKVAEGLALQMANGYAIDSAKNSIQMIDHIHNKDVKKTAKFLANQTRQYMAVAVVGDVQRVPIDKELI